MTSRLGNISKAGKQKQFLGGEIGPHQNKETCSTKDRLRGRNDTLNTEKSDFQITHMVRDMYLSHANNSLKGVRQPTLVARFKTAKDLMGHLGGSVG